MELLRGSEAGGLHARLNAARTGRGGVGEVKKLDLAVADKVRARIGIPGLRHGFRVSQGPSGEGVQGYVPQRGGMQIECVSAFPSSA